MTSNDDVDRTSVSAVVADDIDSDANPVLNDTSSDVEMDDDEGNEGNDGDEGNEGDEGDEPESESIKAMRDKIGKMKKRRLDSMLEKNSQQIKAKQEQIKSL